MTFICTGAVMDPDSLAEAQGRLKPVEGGQEDPEEPVYAKVHHEDPDAIRVIQEEPEAALEAVLEAASQAGSGAVVPVEVLLPPPKPRRLGWIRRGPRRYQLRTVQEEDTDAARFEAEMYVRRGKHDHIELYVLVFFGIFSQKWLY